MNITPLTTANADQTIDRALHQLAAAGISFQIVDRCPGECAFCDEALRHAA